MYIDIEHFQDNYLRIYEVYEKSKKDAKALLEKSKTKFLTKNEVTSVNGVFNLHNMTCGNRPKVFQFMKKDVLKRAKKLPKMDSN